LGKLGLAYHLYFSETNKAPTNASDLAPYYGKPPETGSFDNYWQDSAGIKHQFAPGPEITEALDKGWIVFYYKVTPVQMPQGTSNTILAYERDPDSRGMRWIVRGDGSFEAVSAGEFEQMPKPGK